MSYRRVKRKIKVIVPEDETGEPDFEGSGEDVTTEIVSEDEDGNKRNIVGRMSTKRSLTEQDLNKLLEVKR